MASSSAKTQLSISLLLVWTACLAAMFSLFGGNSEEVVKAIGQEKAPYIHAFSAIWSLVIGTQLTAVLVWWFNASDEQPRDFWHPGMWLLLKSVIVFGVSLPSYAIWRLRDEWWFFKFSKIVSLWANPITGLFVSLVSVVIFIVALSGYKGGLDSRPWKLFFGTAMLYQFGMAILAIGYLVLMFVHESSNSWRYSQSVSIADSVWLWGGSGLMIIALVNDLRNRRQRNGLHWCGIATALLAFMLGIGWRILLVQ